MPPKNTKKIPEVKCTEALVFSDPTLVTVSDYFKTSSPLLKKIVGRAALDFMIDNLSTNKVDEVTIACTSHYDAISSHCDEADYPLKVNCVDVSGLHFVDALNKIGKMSLFSSNFYLINGPVLSNIPFSHYFNLHKERQRTDSSFCVSAFFKKGGVRRHPKSPEIMIQRQGDDEIINVIQSISSDMFAADVHSILQNGVSIINEPSLINVLITDSVIFELAAEHFDKQEFEEFLYTIIATGAILGRKVGSFILKKPHYASALYDPASQLQIDHDLRSCFIWPFTPDNNYNFCNEAPSYDANNNTLLAASAIDEASSNDIYLGCDSVILRGGNVTESVIGCNTEIQGAANVRESIIGDNCIVMGTLNGCAVENGVTIEPNQTFCNKYITQDSVYELVSDVESIKIDMPSFDEIAREDPEVIAARQREEEFNLFDRDMKKIASMIPTFSSDQLNGLSTEVRTLCANANLFDVAATFWTYVFSHIFSNSINNISCDNDQKVKEDAVKSMTLFASVMPKALLLNNLLVADQEFAIFDFFGAFQSFMIKDKIDSITAQSALSFLLSKNMVSHDDFAEWFSELEDLDEKEDELFLDLVEPFYISIMGEGDHGSDSEYEDGEYEYEEYEYEE